MNALRLARAVMGGLVSIGLLAGCGGGQLSQSTTAPSLASPSALKMPGSSGDLVYATGACGGTCVFSYPGGKLVGTLGAGGNGAYACSDSAGNVFITHESTVTEYAHGATSPSQTLSLSGGLATGCSVDPTTGNLAVVFEGSGGDVAIFPHAQGTPSLYNSHIESLFCGYDNAGNLFVNGYDGQQFALSELPIGSGTFSELALDQSVGGPPVQIQWDGKHMTWESGQPVKLSRLSISGSTASIVSRTRVDIKRRAEQSEVARLSWRV